MNTECVSIGLRNRIEAKIRRARAFYNDIVGVLRTLYDAMQAFVLERTPQTARDLVR